MIFPESTEDVGKALSVGLLVRFMLVLITFLMNVALLNIFIAVVTESYSSAYTKRTQLFFKERAEVVRDIAVQASIFGDCFFRRQGEKATHGDPDDDGSTRQERQHQRHNQHQKKGDYLWYCSGRGDESDQP